MSDLIKQAKEYADLSEVVTTAFYDDENEEWSIKSTTIRDVLDTVCDDYTVFPSTQQWTPVTERLPKEVKETYWVCTDSGAQCECRWTNINHFWTGLTTNWHWHIMDIPKYTKVVAWMPLPEPYRGGDAE